MNTIIKYFLLLLLICFYYPQLDIISGFSSKSLASNYYIGNNRTKIEIENSDNDIDMINLTINIINEIEKYTISSIYGLKARKAIYREGLGVTLINNDFNISEPNLVPKRIKIETNLPFPYGNNEPEYCMSNGVDYIFTEIDYNKLNLAVSDAFDKENEKLKRTRSVLVMYKDKIIAEKYDDKFDKNSRIHGWSMTKSITGALFGVLQKQGKIDIYKPAPISEWIGDERANITINDLLHMNSGLEWDENYKTVSDVNKMLFLETNMTKSQLIKRLQFKPNTNWKYSSGTTNLLSAILRNQFTSYQEYLDFWYSELIDKIGMHSMIIEVDMAGNYVGSSYGWATTRDWSKFGLLYLHNGHWNGEQILDKSWIKYSTTPTNSSDGKYGAHFWLNAGGKFPDVPRDMYYCSGYRGQMIAIIPSLDMVIVRMGLQQYPEFDLNEFLKGIISSVKHNSPNT